MGARIVFGMSEAEYHAYPAFSSSGVRDMLVSPLTYWSRSYMNPDREPRDTAAKDYGTAFHKLMLEGREAFDKCYAVEVSPEDHPDHLKSGNDLKAECTRLGVAASGTIAAMSQRIRDADVDAKLFYFLEQEHLAANADKRMLSKKEMARLELGWKAWQANPERHLLEGGWSEVSVFWREEVVVPETGEIVSIECKARFDKLKAGGAIIDLKTFSNSKEKRVEQAVMDSFATRRYGIQGYMYLRALEALAEAGVVEIWGDTTVTDAGPLIGPNPSFTLIFQESGFIPNILVRDFLRYNPMGENTYYIKAAMDYDYALQQHARCMSTYGTEPWVDALPRAPIYDHDLPAWAIG